MKFSITTMLIFATLLTGQTAIAAPPGFDISTTTFADPFRGAAALAYASDGTLYVVEGVDFLAGPNTTSIRVFAPSGTPLASLSVTGEVQNISPSGAAVDLSGNLLITDNQANRLYSINTTTGVQSSFAFTLGDIDDVAVRPGTGEIFVSDAAGFGGGGVYQIDGLGDTSPTPVVTGLDFAAGLDFDASGNLIYQNASLTSPSSFTTEGDVYRLDITETPTGLAFGSSSLLAAGLIGQSDLAVDSDGDIFVTGGDFSSSGGLYQLDRDAVGDFTGTATLFEVSTGTFGLFSTELDFLAGATGFEPNAGPAGGTLSFLADFNATVVTNIQPSGSVNGVPEPSSIFAALICAFVGLFGYRLARRRAV